MRGEGDSPGFKQPDYLDFELTIDQGDGRQYPLFVIRSPAGEANETMHFPYDELALESHLSKLEIALLRSQGKTRRFLSPEEQAVQNFGQDLFDALFTGEVRSRFDVSYREATQQGRGLRLKLCIRSPELAALPWEFLYDPRQSEYISLSRNTPIIRYMELPQPVQPLTVNLPLRILGMVASPEDQVQLDVEREKRRLDVATRALQSQGLVELTWMTGQTWRDLQRAIRHGPWHILHFIGHGGFDHSRDEGFIVLADREGMTHRLGATHLARLLAGHFPLRLVLLNSCEGAHGSKLDTVSSTAATLIRRGIPALLAMQYEITDRAAVEFASTFYEALSDGMPVDGAVIEARIAVSLATSNTVEWGVPVLYMRSIDGLLFELVPGPVRSTVEQEQRIPEPPPTPVAAQLRSTISVETLGGAATPLIYRGSELPAQVSQTFSTAEDSQSQVEVHLVLGENRMATDNVSLGKFLLSDIPAAAKGIPQIDVTLNVDTDLQLSVTATERGSGRSSELGSVDLSKTVPPPVKDPLPEKPVQPQDSEGFTGIEDIFESFFGGGRAGPAQAGPTPGADLRHDLTVELEEAAFGVEKEIIVRRHEMCARCKGTGAEPGTKPIRCPQCNGTGEIRRQQQTLLGTFNQATTCPRCQGEREIVTSPCSRCKGRKAIEVDRSILVKIPAGVDKGTRVRLRGEGEPGIRGGPPGHIYVVIDIAPHPLFMRNDLDLYLSLPISVSYATAGGKIRIPELEKGKFSIRSIPPQTENGHTFQLPGKGVRSLKEKKGKRAHGDLVVTLEVFHPRKMSSDLKKRIKIIKERMNGHEIEFR